MCFDLWLFGLWFAAEDQILLAGQQLMDYKLQTA
jgi:hypothetical protein